MAKFIYKFENIKRVKETLEKKVQKEINLIELQINSLQKNIEDVNKEKEQTLKSISQQKNIKVSELQFRYKTLNLLELQIIKMNNEIDQLEIQKKKKLQELQQRSKEHKVFETLEEKHEEHFREEQNHIDQKIIDEIASTKFAREG